MQHPLPKTHNPSSPHNHKTLHTKKTLNNLNTLTHPPPRNQNTSRQSTVPTRGCLPPRNNKQRGDHASAARKNAAEPASRSRGASTRPPAGQITVKPRARVSNWPRARSAGSRLSRGVTHTCRASRARWGEPGADAPSEDARGKVPRLFLSRFSLCRGWMCGFAFRGKWWKGGW